MQSQYIHHVLHNLFKHYLVDFFFFWERTGTEYHKRKCVHPSAFLFLLNASICLYPFVRWTPLQQMRVSPRLILGEG